MGEFFDEKIPPEWGEKEFGSYWYLQERLPPWGILFIVELFLLFGCLPGRDGLAIFHQRDKDCLSDDCARAAEDKVQDFFLRKKHWISPLIGNEVARMNLLHSPSSGCDILCNLLQKVGILIEPFLKKFKESVACSTSLNKSIQIGLQSTAEDGTKAFVGFLTNWFLSRFWGRFLGWLLGRLCRFFCFLTCLLSRLWLLEFFEVIIEVIVEVIVGADDSLFKCVEDFSPTIIFLDIIAPFLALLRPMMSNSFI